MKITYNTNEKIVQTIREGLKKKDGHFCGSSGSEKRITANRRGCAAAPLFNASTLSAKTQKGCPPKRAALIYIKLLKGGE